MKYYIRDGRRFVQIKSLKGMFYNNNGTFTENRTNKSIGICVHDDFEEIIIASLSVAENPVRYDVAESACKAAFPFVQGHMPSRKELYMSMEYKQHINTDYHILWTSDSRKNNYARAFVWSNGYTPSLNKRTLQYVLPFLTIKK